MKLSVEYPSVAYREGPQQVAALGRAVEAIGYDETRRQAEEAGRDPASIGTQMMLQAPPTDEAGKRFYADLDAVVARAAELIALDFEWLAINATAVFQAGARSVAAMEDQLGAIDQRLRPEFE